MTKLTHIVSRRANQTDNTKHVAVTAKIYTVDGVVLRHEFDGYGNHRLIGETREGEWTGYHSLAHFKLHMQEIRASSEYFGETLPRVFSIVPGREL